jgi:hypothetical protein
MQLPATSSDVTWLISLNRSPRIPRVSDELKRSFRSGAERHRRSMTALVNLVTPDRKPSQNYFCTRARALCAPPVRANVPA